MFSDFSQLSLILDFLMYINISWNLLSNNDFIIYKLFREMYKLNVIQRQSENSKKQQDFRDIFLQLYNRESTLNN